MSYLRLKLDCWNRINNVEIGTWLNILRLNKYFTTFAVYTNQKQKLIKYQLKLLKLYACLSLFHIFLCYCYKALDKKLCMRISAIGPLKKLQKNQDSYHTNYKKILLDLSFATQIWCNLLICTVRIQIFFQRICGKE